MYIIKPLGGLVLNKYEIAEAIKGIILEGEVRIDEPMKSHTTFKVGGNADIFIVPENKQEIVSVINCCNQHNIPLLIIGNGSNLIVRDKGIRGIVMQIYNKFSKIEVYEDIIIAQAGILLSKLSSIALEKRLSGLEFASGIPGTLGGAIVMNAGAYGGEMKDIVEETTYIDNIGDIGIVKADDHHFGYRSSCFQNKGCIVLESKLKLKYGIYSEIKAVIDDLNKRRREKQPLNYPSAGSVFKRPEGYYAGKLIEDCGLKGYSIGGAQVSGLHAGFIINNKNATSKDVTDLILYIQNKVREKFGVELETEVKIVGEE